MLTALKSQKGRLALTIGISLTFFCAELVGVLSHTPSSLTAVVQISFGICAVY
jgi:hypothetical protein